MGVRGKFGLVMAAVLMGLLLLSGGPAGAQEPETTDIVLVIDNSKSMNDSDPKRWRFSAARLFIDLAREGDRVGVVVFSQWIDEERSHPLTAIGEKSRKELKEKLSSAEGYGGTDMFLALQEALKLLNDPAHKRVIVFLTDGEPDRNREEVLAEIGKFQSKERQDILVFPIALGRWVDKDLLQEFDRRSRGRFFAVDDPADLTQIYAEILSALHDGRYVDIFPLRAEKMALSAEENQAIRRAKLVVPKAAPDVQTDLSPPAANTFSDEWYTVYILESGMPLAGRWELSLSGWPKGMEGKGLALIESALRVNLYEPWAEDPTDSTSPRPYPAGLPLYVSLGVEGTGGQILKEISPQANGQPLFDNGSQVDRQAGDGHFSGIIAPAQAITVEVPLTRNEPFRLVKSFPLDLKARPALSVQTSAQDVRLGQPLTLTAGAPSARIISLEGSLQQPDGEWVTLAFEPRGEEWAAAFRPWLSGQYNLSLISHLEAGEETYTAYHEESLTLEVPRWLRVQLDPLDLGEIDDFHAGHVLVATVSSYSTAEEALRLRAEGLEGATVSPAEIALPPAARPYSLTVPLTITSPASMARGEAASFHLLFEPRDSQTKVEGASQEVAYYPMPRALTVQAESADLGKVVDFVGGQAVRVTVKSRSPKEEKLEIGVAGLGEAKVSPEQIAIPPGATETFTLQVSSPIILEPGPRAFQLTFSSPEGEVQVEGARLEIAYSLLTWAERFFWPLLALLFLCLFIGYMDFNLLRASLNYVLFYRGRERLGKASLYGTLRLFRKSALRESGKPEVKAVLRGSKVYLYLSDGAGVEISPEKREDGLVYAELKAAPGGQAIYLIPHRDLNGASFLLDENGVHITEPVRFEPPGTFTFILVDPTSLEEEYVAFWRAGWR